MGLSRHSRVVLDSYESEFFFVRHAESLWNQRQLCQGTLDVDLSPQGLSDAAAFAKKSASLSIDAIYSSPLMRALKTAKEIHKFHPLVKLCIVDELRERCFGDFQGKPSKEMYAFEASERQGIASASDCNAEPEEALKKRLTSGLSHILQAHSKPLIVSHGRLFRTLCELLDLPKEFQLPNLALIRMKQCKGVWTSHTIEIESL